MAWWHRTLKRVLQDPTGVTDNARRRGLLLDVSRILELASLRREDRNGAGRRCDPELLDLLTVVPNDIIVNKAGLDRASEGKEGGEHEILDDNSNKVTERENNAVIDTINAHLPPCQLAALQGHSDMLNVKAGWHSTGKGFHFLDDQAALLELALVNYAVSKAIEHGYRPTLAPDVVRADAVAKAGFAPRHVHPDPIFRLATSRHSAQDKDDDDDRDELVLAATSELTMLSRLRESILPRKLLPAKFVAVSHCFRRELGLGLGHIYRVHQFTKVELFVVSRVDDPCDYLLADIVPLQRSIVRELGLPARILHMAPHELGLSARRKYDIEVKFSDAAHGGADGKQGEHWGEVTSASDCGTFQSERFGIRWSDGPGLPVRGPVNTWNGTALAVPRILMALLSSGPSPPESAPAELSSLQVPSCLRRFLLSYNSGKH